MTSKTIPDLIGTYYIQMDDPFLCPTLIFSLCYHLGTGLLVIRVVYKAVLVFLAKGRVKCYHLKLVGPGAESS